MKAMDSLLGKRCVIFGVANDRSICWGIAKQLKAAGAELALVSHPTMRDRVVALASTIEVKNVYSCDVSDPDQVKDVFEMLAGFEAPIWGAVHGIAFSDRNELRGRFIETSRDNFVSTMLVSCYSFIEMARRLEPLMTEGGSIVTLTFDGSQGPYPHYNIMGPAKAALEASVKYASFDLGEHKIRVNAIAASPEDTLSARGIQHFRVIGDWAEGMSPLGRRATIDEIAAEAAHLLSPAASGITGQVRYVDCGSSVSKLPPVRNAPRIHGAMGRVIDITGSKKDGAS